MMTRIGILTVGEVDSEILNRIAENLRTIFVQSEIVMASEVLPIPEEAFRKTRRQHRSDIILKAIRRIAERDNFDKVLGVTHVDLFIPELNFVFGQAECPGRGALISLFRLRPEFYRRPPNVESTIERGTKEAVHEIGHTLGLKHCANPFCAMYFSNSIFETDRKVGLFCSKCQLKVYHKAVDQGKKFD